MLSALKLLARLLIFYARNILEERMRMYVPFLTSDTNPVIHHKAEGEFLQLGTAGTYVALMNGLKLWSPRFPIALKPHWNDN